VRRTLPSLLASAALVAGAVPAAAQAADVWVGIDDLGLPTPTPAQHEDAVVRYTAEGTVRPLETRTEDAGDVVVSLAADILFDTDEAELDDPARARIAEIVAEVPAGTTVAVHGHTDTVGEEAYNQDLSVRRAGAVADAVRAARPELALDVQGFGETSLAVREPEGGGEPANRRVELRYRS